MIIKKPYAFLIKNFRLIHGLLFVLLLYLTIKSFTIMSFFADYSSTHNYVIDVNLASKYINYFIFIVAILASLVALVINYILHMKNKEGKLYLFIFLDMIILFVYFIYMFYIFTKLQTNLMDTETVRIYRDISIIILLPLIVLLFIVLGRTLGFNIRQFDFKKDLEELEITDTDNEEVELSLGTDTYKISRFFRKMLRLSKYFVLENKMFVIGLASILILIGCLTIFMDANVYSVTHQINEQVLANKVYYTVKESYYTENNISNKKINNGKKYILISVFESNKFTTNATISRETFNLIVNEEEIEPVFSYNDSFSDVGRMFSPHELMSGEDKNYYVVFEIDSSINNSEFILKIKNFDDKTLGNIETKYISIIVKPENLDFSENEGTYKLPANLDFSKTLLKNSQMKITSFDIADNFKEKYTYMVGGVEKEGIYNIIPNTVGKGEISVLKIVGSFSMDESLYINKYIKTHGDLLEYYGIIRYRYLGNYQNISLKNMNAKYNKDKIAYLEVPSELKEANKIDLIVLIRGVKYTINLK